MPREMEGYREQLVRLSERFPNREAISIKECCETLPLNRRTILSDETFPVKRVSGKATGKYIIPLVALARWMCQIDRK